MWHKEYIGQLLGKRIFILQSIRTLAFLGQKRPFKDWCQGAMEPGIYEFDPNKKSLKLITRVNPSDVLNRTMIYKELIATRKENGNIEVIDKNKNVKYKDIDKSVSQHGSFSAVKVKSKTVLIIVEMNNDIHFYDIENRELIEKPIRSRNKNSR